MKTLSFTRERFEDHAPIIIYGGGTCGQLALDGLRRLGLDASYFCDKAYPGKQIRGVEVLSPEQLIGRPDAHVLIASATFFSDMLHYLKRIGHSKYYNVLALISDKKHLEGKTLEERFDLANLITTYSFAANYAHDSRRANLTTLDVVVTERCSLKCRDCANAMQYYRRPRDCDLQLARQSLERYLACVDFLPKAFIIGGEPFMNPEVHRIIEWCSDHPKIGSIWIFTNGSIIPHGAAIAAMKKPKVMVRLSDYGGLVQNLPAFVDCLLREQIPYKRFTCDVWQDLGPMRERHYSPEQVQEVFASCECRDIFTLLNGRIYHCPWSAHGDNLGLIQPNADDVIDLMNQSIPNDRIERSIRYLKDECTGLSACGYCNGRGASAPTIPAAVQRRSAKADRGPARRPYAEGVTSRE